MTTITVSTLPNINFYTGTDASFAGESVENRRYGEHSDYYGYLGLSSSNNTYWTGIANSTFGENKVNYNNIGDVINATISYMNKFKNNTIDISIEKNVLTFNYKLEEDLNNDFNNIKLIPASQLLDLLVNVNDMTFNKRNYYSGNNELKEITYAHKKYPYNGPNTVINVNDPEHENQFIAYDFSKQYVDYKYSVFSEDVEFTRSYMEPYTLIDGTIAYRDTGFTYIETITYYTYEINDINKFEDRVNVFFDNNTERVENKYGDKFDELKSYYISDFDTVMTMTLNTYSLASKNLYAYFNFTNNYENWFDKSIALTMNTSEINNDDTLLTIEPITESWFNIIINEHDKPCGDDVKLNSLYDFKVEDKDAFEENQLIKIINPSNIKKLDISENTDKLININFVNNYNKRINVNTTQNLCWLDDTEAKLETLIVGNENKVSTIENILGINKIPSLKYVDITNCSNFKKEFSISKLNNLNVFKAKGSNIKNFIPKQNSNFTTVELPESLKTLILKNTTITNFDYQPTGNLINLTLNNVTGIDTKTFVIDWINQLETTKINPEGDESDNNKVLYNGIVTNTNLQGINWSEFPIDTLCKFRYLGLEKFEGIIGIKGSDLTRKEYLQLRDVFGDEIMETGKYTSNSKPIKFEYTLDPYAYKKDMYLYYYVENYGWQEEMINDNPLHIASIEDNKGGNSLLDYFENINRLELTLNNEKFGYEVELLGKIYTDNNNKSSLTKQLNPGDIVLYKGNKLIFVTSSKNSPYNYIKLGHVSFNQRLANNIIISFSQLDINSI